MLLQSMIVQNCSRIVTRSGTTLYLMLMHGVSVIEKGDTPTESSKLVDVMLEYEVFAMEGTRVALGPVLMALREMGGPGSTVPPHSFVLLSCQLAVKAGLIDFNSDTGVLLPACVQGKLFFSRLLAASKLPSVPSYFEYTYAPGFTHLIEQCNAEFHTEFICFLRRATDKLESTGEKLAVSISFIDPSNGNETEQYDIDDAVEVCLQSGVTYTDSNRDSKLFTALQASATMVLGECNLEDVFSHSSFRGCFNEHYHHSVLKHPWTILIGCDYVLYYTWNGTRIVIDKRAIMMRLLGNAQPCQGYNSEEEEEDDEG
ncbi:hypothetical protein EMIHUDRAFT_442401 [Emiliania huxleyi CCMP1516]|uniref:Uncharacterized protein n=2 Tax=Emiliania huxleyi TaxID=2903 RepID=A0A0D3K4K4_EMIH1|nr:hypothetical protein EMIHUDRAFT_442401 [Emiliania huxleyi CCMP1516]EOD30689.1 hypothetical protein EMIHUDRAFT_442401 [Emiliania huxleyi CCMP1516]|eukprot:XP_005783118.1 hypothetical protein EMIHUDRAFT_442401 [Emiliania huxleyi CCMP1516]